ncbi:MAG: tetratricopeptide repeat protein [Deltaproteobacteria bacterium]|nr:tetratricopeptide repeat protein [Deltaproteobacteria bacterium]
MIELPQIPDKEELEKRLGETCKLDGSFGSLWAVEVLLRAIRNRTEWLNFCPWVPSYILSVFARAFGDMGLSFTERAQGIYQAGPRGFIIDMTADYQMLLHPPVPFPVLGHHSWRPVPVLHLAACPWYGLSVLFGAQNHNLHEAENPTRADTMQKLMPKRVEKTCLGSDGAGAVSAAPERGAKEPVLSWLVKDYMQYEIRADDISKSLAEKILRAMLWPLLCDDQNKNATENLGELGEIFKAESKMDDFVNVILRLVVSQDRMISVLAGAACFLINIAPTSSLEARCFKRCLQYFGTPPLSISGEDHERALEIIKILTSSSDAQLKGVDDGSYLETIKLANQDKWDQALLLITRLIETKPDHPLYLRSRGKLYEKMGKKQLAHDDYNTALAIKPDYWQALINRAACYTAEQNYKLAESDYIAALKLRPDCEDTRDNLLRVYFLKNLAEE